MIKIKKIQFPGYKGFKIFNLVAVIFIFTSICANALFSQLPPNIKIPDSEYGGNPIGEVLVAGDKLIAYSPKKIFIYSATDNSLLETIEISSVGKFNPRYFTYSKHICDLQVMTYNETENDVYYISPDLKIYCLDLDNYNTELLLSTPAQISHFKYLIGPVNLKFDASHNRLFWVIQGRDENENSTGIFHVLDSYLAAYDVTYTSGTPYLTLIEDQFEVNGTGNYENAYHNLVFCDDNNYFFVPKKGRIDIYEILSNNTFSINTITFTEPFKLSKMLYINDGNFHKVLVFPYRLPYDGLEPVFELNVDFYVIDCDDPFNPQTGVERIQSPSKRVIDAAYLPEEDKLVVCFSPDNHEQPQEEGNDVAVYDVINGEFVLDYKKSTNGHPENTTGTTLNRPIKLSLYNENSVLISKKDELIRFYPSNGTYTTIRDGISNYFYDGTVYEPGGAENNKSFVINAVGGFIEIYEDSEPLQRINTSNSVYHIIPITGTSKIVAFNKLNTHKSLFFIYNTETGETIESEEIDGAIGDIIYNPNYSSGNEILVAVNSNPGKVSRYYLNGQYKGDITFPSSNVDYNYMRKMFINPNGKLFLTSNMNNSLVDVEPRLLVFDAADYSFIKEHTITMPTYSYNFYFYNADFCYNSQNGLTYMIISPGQRYEGGGGTAPEYGIPDPYQSTTNYLKDQNYTGNNNGWLVKYDETTNTPENVLTLSFPKEVLYVNPNNNGPSEDQGLLFINADQIYKFNCASEEITSFGISMYKITNSNLYPNRLFGISDEEVTNSSDRNVLIFEIYFDGTSSQMYDIPGQAGSFFLNPYNGLLYVYQKIDEAKLGDEPIRLFEIDPLQYNNQGYEAVETDLDNTCIYPDLDYNPDASATYYNFTTPFIDPEDNKIYLPNGGHSNISVVDFDPADILEIGNDITWLSFPRLDRPGNTTVSVDDALLDMINPSYDNESDLEYYIDGVSYFSEYDFFQHTWNPDPINGLYSVRSDLGYVLDLEYGSSPDPVLLHMRGTQPDPNDPPYIQLTDQYQTWAGYWLEESQYPLDAIPEDDLLYMYRIEGQYWTCQREPLPDNAQPPYYQFPFVCSENRGSVELNYGDMVKIFASADLSFTWLSNTGGDPGVERLATENYTYVEQTDYTPLYVELDTTSNPEEIGAFVGDSCVGATTVLEDDSLVLVLGYMDGISGDLTFQEYTSNKASALQKKDYWVLDNNSGQWEKRKLSNKDRKGSYFISLRGDKKQSLKVNETDMGLVCIPNPVNENCRIQYYISKDANVQIMLYDIYGNLRDILYSGDTRAGQYEIQWNVFDKNENALPKGIYVVKMQSEGQIVQNKIIITK